MRFVLLGPMAVEDRAGARGTIGGARLRMLLAALLLHPGAPVSAEMLIEAVWGEAPPPGAIGTLRSYISRLRQSLGPEAGERIEAREPGYLIRVDESELDVLEFEALCRLTAAARGDIEGMRARRSPPRASAASIAAAARYSGGTASAGSWVCAFRWCLNACLNSSNARSNSGSGRYGRLSGAGSTTISPTRGRLRSGDTSMPDSVVRPRPP